MNTFGDNLRVTTFGESHGKAMGGIIDGFPSGFKIDMEALKEEMAKRRPGSSNFVSKRKEADIPEFLSGINSDGITLGSPIGFLIWNQDAESSDYEEIAEKFRPNHADYTYQIKYGIRDCRGGGRASARETVNWVVAGALAQQWLKQHNIEIYACLSRVGKISYVEKLIDNLSGIPSDITPLTIPDNVIQEMEEEITKAKKEGDSIGGVVTCVIKGLKSGIGNPIFDKLQSRLAAAMLTINASKGFEYGYGFKSAGCRGSEILDIFMVNSNNSPYTSTNYSGGIQGGISNGMPIYFNVAFKPTPSIIKKLPTINKDLQETELKVIGRHDPCVAVRAVPVVKAMAALVVIDFLL